MLLMWQIKPHTREISMFKTLEQLEKSNLQECYKAQLRPHFPDATKMVKPNKYHNIHVYLCKKCDSFLSIVDLKFRSFECPLCGKVSENQYRFFMSKKEAAYYLQLRVMQRAGIVKQIECQVPYKIKLSKPGSDKKETIKYLLDFRVTYTDEHIEHVDVKGKRLPDYINKKKLIEDHFKITIIEV